MIKLKPALYIVFTIITAIILGCAQEPKWLVKPMTFENYKSFLDGKTPFREFVPRYDDDTGNIGKTAWVATGDFKHPDEKLRISKNLEFYGDLFYSHETRKYQLKDLKTIFDYLTEHKNYFFNGEEMVNRKITDFNSEYTAIPHLEKKTFMFSLIISFSKSDENESWLISKCVDVLNDDMKGLYDICFSTVTNNEIKN